MHKAFRKIIISSISVMIVLITMVATTYAWVGMLSYSTIGEFNINLQTENKNSDYNLYISPTGDYKIDGDTVIDSFKARLDNSDLLNIKKQILINMDKYNESYLTSESGINTAFNKVALHPTSPIVKERKIDLTSFLAYDNKIKNYTPSLDYFKFDIYLSIDSTNGEITEDTNYLIDLYIKDLANSISGQTVSGSIVNSYTFDNDYISSIEAPEGFTKLGEIKSTEIIQSNSAYSTRMAVQYYAGIPITDTYGNEKPIGQYIYQAGTQNALYDNDKQLYSFGGVLETKNNLAVSEFNKIYNIDLENIYNEYATTNNLVDYTEIYNVRKNDLLLKEENNIICDNTSMLQLGIIDGKRYKVKLSLYFWYEGWDADCFSIIDNSRTNLSLTFASNFKDNEIGK